MANTPGSTDVPFNQPIILQFNRLLNPSTVTRQAIQLTDSSGRIFVDPLVDYDPVLLRVTLSNPNAGLPLLAQGQGYRITFPVAAPGTTGVQAIDNATFAQATTLIINATASKPFPAEPTMHYCVDIQPIFTAKCAGVPFCHGQPAIGGSVPEGGSPPLPAQGLILDSSEGLAKTAIGHVAHESNVGPTAGAGQAAGAIFGIQMPIIDPGTKGNGNPGNSWMLYKALLAPPGPAESLTHVCNPYTTFGGGFPPGAGQVLGTDSSNERMRLSNFIIGREMPYPSNPSVPEGQPDASPDNRPLSLDELERLRLWIKQGAQLENVTMVNSAGKTVTVGPNCSLCQTIPDAGASDAPPAPDAAMDASDGAPDGGADGSGDAGGKG